MEIMVNLDNKILNRKYPHRRIILLVNILACVYSIHTSSPKVNELVVQNIYGKQKQMLIEFLPTYIIVAFRLKTASSVSKYFGSNEGKYLYVHRGSRRDNAN